MTSDLVVRRTRYALAAVITLTAVGLIVLTRMASGIHHRTAEYVLIHFVNIGSIVVPVVVVIDFLLSIFRAVVSIREGNLRAAAKRMAWTFVADVLLMVLAFGAALAVLRWRG